MKHPAPLKLFLQRMAKESPSVIQQNHDTECKVKTDVAWIPGWELSDLLLWVSDLRFWIGASRPISNRYRIQSKNCCCLDSWVAGTYPTVCYDLQIQFSGKEFPDRYQTDTESNAKMDFAWITGCARALRLAFMTFRFDVLDRSFRPIPNRYRIQNKSYCCLDSCEVAFRLAFMIFRFDFLDRSFRLLI